MVGVGLYQPERKIPKKEGKEMALEPISEEEKKRIHLEQPRIEARDISGRFDWEHIPPGRDGWLEVLGKLYFSVQSAEAQALSGGDVTEKDIKELKQRIVKPPRKRRSV